MTIMNSIEGLPFSEVGVSDQRSVLLEAAYREHAPRLRQLAHSILGSPAHIDDVVQDAFAKALRSKTGIDHHGAYLRTAVVNGCRDRMRREAVAARGLRRIGNESEVVLDDPDLGEMWGMVRRLRPKQRVVLALRYGEDLSEQQIADELQIPIGTVKTHIARGLAALRKEMK